MKPGIGRRLRTTAVVVVLLTLGAAVCHTQIWRGGYGRTPPKFPTATTFKGDFNFCRLLFSSDRREKRGWDTDYPGADINFSIRLSELTKTRVPTEYAGGDPDHVVVRIMDDALFQCPFVLMEDAGTAWFSDSEMTQLRAYLQKGGFILVADYWGTRARMQWDRQIGRVLQPAQYPIVDIPMEHAIWHTLFDLESVPQIPSIQSWRRSGGRLSERGSDSQHVDVRGIADEHGRLMVLMLHNTDIPDGWEREAEDPEYFYLFSPDAYTVGINVMMYAMTH
jgi:hypothetical protein